MTMTPEEAISVNTRLAKELDIPQRAEERKAVKLGIEALRLLINLRSGHDVSLNSLLPSEAEANL